MKVLVTGATGFLGYHVIHALLKKNCTIITTSSNLANAKEKDWYNKTRHIPFELSTFDDSINYYEFFDQPDLMIHLAWEGLPNYKSDFHEKVNLPRHVLFLTNLIRNGLKDLTVTGTCLEYGMEEGCLNEDMDVHPDNSYGVAKHKLRVELEGLKSKYEFSFKWVRLFYMYGKGQNPNSLLSQLEAALERGDEEFNMSGGEQIRDYLPVEIVAKNIVLIALQKSIEGIINNCSGVPVSIRDFVSDYLKSKNKKIKLNLGVHPYPDYEPMRFWGDAGKLKKITKDE
jgi:dTDP-6-deoxy-L-talose 4-dehydrogenase (NAD+)